MYVCACMYTYVYIYIYTYAHYISTYIYNMYTHAIQTYLDLHCNRPQPNVSSDVSCLARHFWRRRLTHRFGASCSSRQASHDTYSHFSWNVYQCICLVFSYLSICLSIWSAFGAPDGNPAWKSTCLPLEAFTEFREQSYTLCVAISLANPTLRPNPKHPQPLKRRWP